MSVVRRILNNTGLFLLAIGLLVLGFRYLKQNKPAKRVNQGIQIYAPDRDVNAFVFNDSVVWIGGKEGVTGYNLASDVFVPLPATSHQIDYVNALIIDSIGILWIAFDRGLGRYDGQFLTILDLPDEISGKGVNTVYRDQENRIWIGTWSGAAVLENNKWTIINDELIHPMVNCIYQDENKGLWFGSYVAPRGGISYFNHHTWRHWTTEQGLPHPNITAIVENDSAFLFGTGLLNRGGLFSLQKDPHGGPGNDFRVLDQSAGLAGEKVRSLFVDSKNRLWCGFEYDGITVLSESRQLNLDLSDGLSHNEVKYINERSDGYWIGTRKGLTFFPVASFGRIWDIP